ncbi:GTP-binding protein yptV5, putative [Entamoeba invadens IP1]|uniref:GTP-binding protein yptV5, putative n=1 Tax=Entamoeba invadens IP1 TaxID=370355 RepID=A0A0A1U9X0_ENTIV|nr:GTP-binding protein yptV5, putative [Entamoeba invadens IP1]ELP91858.1 GTP-binding protein yptV5, putative [Entamoeba invadens IP1]|eukprot:XP_004258629.1 GTP-binding protein yptV5, putative [Entamoeba invadens IP1]
MSKTRLLKTILIGTSGVGKTALITTFCCEKFTNNYKATIGADFVTKSMIVGNKEVSMQIWDTAGNERFVSLSVAFYRGADCCGLVFDVSNEKSFERLLFWKDEFLRNACTSLGDDRKYPFVIIGNKTDKPAVITSAMVAEWIVANDVNAVYIETSASTGVGVDTAFNCLAKKALEHDPGDTLTSQETHIQPFYDDEDDDDERATCC